ncbi:hypothetical protein F5B20DRAFT_8035 [Whalleya microplaca]|nr:hypothetical protein F5B20DRAFT_8035 [Whalleya microplaca]
MPFRWKDAPASVPTAQTIEALLGRPNESTPVTKKIKTFNELTGPERERNNLVSLGTRCTRIPGDPFGLLTSWAGNVAHPEDARIFDIMDPLFDELLSGKPMKDYRMKAINSLLGLIPTTSFDQIVEELSVQETYKVVKENDQETIVTFKLASSISVRLMQCKDIDKNDESSYGRTTRASLSRAQTVSQLDDPPMTKELTQHIMALLITKDKIDVGRMEVDESVIIDIGPSNTSHTGFRCGGFFYDLKKAAQEKYWYDMSPGERSAARQESGYISNDEQFNANLVIVQINWQSSWDSSAWDPDYFRIYRLDQMAAVNVWELIEEDVFVVVDSNRQVIFANVEHLCQLIWGEQLSEVLVQCFDMWAYFTPLPAPESCRHATDSHIRTIHPELDMSKATAATLPNARMCVAHYGSWASQNDPHGRRIFCTMDTDFLRGGSTAFSQNLFPKFSLAALGKATDMIRCLVKPLDRAYYDEGVEILSSLEDENKITTNEQDFLSLFALGINEYTARHTNKNDISLGLAGLCTFGSYTGRPMLC